MKWYTSAFLICAASCTALALREIALTAATTPVAIVARWTGIGALAFAASALVIGLGCGAPGGGAPRKP